MEIIKKVRKRFPQPQPQDFILKYTILPLLPQWVKPNHLTILRFATTPIVLALLLLENYSWGLPLLILAAFTDALDGSLARTRNQISHWGKVYDPLADKLLLNSALIITGLKYFFYTTLVIILIDLSFIAAGWRWERKGIDIKANFWGKTKMNLQVIGLVILLLAITLKMISLFYASLIILYLAVIFATISLFTYGI